MAKMLLWVNFERRTHMEEQEKEQERKKENAKKAAEYIRRLRDGTIPEFEVHFTFSNSGKKRGSNLL